MEMQDDIYTDCNKEVQKQNGKIDNNLGRRLLQIK